MSGSVTRSGDGWQYVIDAGLDANGRRRQHRRRGFATRKLAQAAMVEAQSAALHGELVGIDLSLLLLALLPVAGALALVPTLRAERLAS